MHFSAAAIFFAAAAAVAKPLIPALPVLTDKPTGGLLLGNNTNLVGELVGVVDKVESGALGADALELKMKGLLGGAVVKVETVLNGDSFADRLLRQIDGGAPHSVVQAAGQAMVLVQKGEDMRTVNAYVRGATDGKVASLDKALGVAGVDKVLRV